MPTTLTPQTFVAKWRKATLKESAAANEHFLDLCRLLDHPTPADVDAEGTTFTFEYGAAKRGGGQGFADVFKRGFFGWEYKGKHANLDRAYQQLLQYRESLHNPPLLVVSDIDTIVVHPNFINRANRPTTLTLDDLLTPAGMATLRAVFTDPHHFENPETPESVTQRIVGDFARIADRLRGAGHASPQIAHFLIRLLFCLFAEDVALLPQGLFARLVERTRQQPAAFAMQLRQLFAAMAIGGWFGADPIPHFNGGLFEDDTALELDGEGMDVLARVAAADWGAIEPSIFGTLFERSLDPDKRSQLGAHYTSKEDILLIVEPVLMAPLRRRWEEVQAQTAGLAAQRDSARGQKRANLDKKLNDLCLDFAAELAAVTVLDPASGSGNFPLPGAALAARPVEGSLQPDAGARADAALPAGGDLADAGAAPRHRDQRLRPRAGAGHHLDRLHPMAARQRVWITARTDPQADPHGAADGRDHGGGQGSGVRGQGSGVRVREPEWPAADVIIGNPPFLGDKKMRAELGDEYVDALRKLYEGRVPGGADLVCYWFEKARAKIEAGKARRAGLLATNSIRMGANRKVLRT